MGDGVNDNVPEKCKRNIPLVERLMGEANESDVVISGVNTKALIDSGSMVTTMSEEFLESLNPKPELRDLTDFKISLIAANGSSFPYIGYVEVNISIPFLGRDNVTVPTLVVPTTPYNSHVPVIIGTNVIRLCRDVAEQADPESIPQEWQVAFSGIKGQKVPVKTTNHFTIKLSPNESTTLHGFVRKPGNMKTAVTEPCDSATADQITVCPRTCIS